MLVQNQVGPLTSTITSLTPGTNIPGRAGALGEYIESPHSPEYYEAVYRRATFNTVVTGSTSVSGGLVTAYSGLAISNPPGSSINAVIQTIGYSFPSQSLASGMVIGLMVGYNATNPVTSSVTNPARSSFIGVGLPGQVVASTSITFPTVPVLSKVFGKIDSGSLGTQTQGSPCLIDIKGNLVLPPGGYAAIYASTGSAANGFFGSIDWQEIPV